MIVRPIPNSLLGDEIILQKPTESGWSDVYVHNVRAERVSSVEGGISQNPYEKTELTVWYDCVNSYPKVSFSVGMRVVFGKEIFEIKKSRVYRAQNPHHCKFTAVKIGETAQNEEV